MVFPQCRFLPSNIFTHVGFLDDKNRVFFGTTKVFTSFHDHTHNIIYSNPFPDGYDFFSRKALSPCLSEEKKGGKLN
jgi:hypothetical protein